MVRFAAPHLSHIVKVACGTGAVYLTPTRASSSGSNAFRLAGSGASALAALTKGGQTAATGWLAFEYACHPAPGAPSRELPRRSCQDQGTNAGRLALIEQVAGDCGISDPDAWM